MYNRSDPRFQRALNDFSQTLESANETAQVGLFSFGHNYIRPCFSSVGRGLNTCVAPCFPRRDDRLRRKRAQSRARPEQSFDFYDDWAEDEWGNDEVEALLGATQDHVDGQPGRQGGMNYGSQDGVERQRGKQSYKAGTDPTMIPQSSYFGFLNKLPFKTAAKGLKYKPSAADLRTVRRGAKANGQADIQEEEEAASDGHTRRTGRGRSGTAGSGNSGRTLDSYSSRGDIFPSDDEEYGDAVPIDDEFAMALERRATSDDNSSHKRPPYSRGSTTAKSSRSGKRRSQASSTKSSSSLADLPESEVIVDDAPILQELEQEEQRVKDEEEQEIETRRGAAQKLARERGLSIANGGSTEVSSISSASVTSGSRTYPFPTLESPDLETGNELGAPPASDPAEVTGSRPSTKGRGQSGNG